MTPSAALAGSVPALLDLLLPTRCAGCGQGRAQLCARCREALSAACAGPADPVPRPAGLPPVHASAAYAGPVRSLLITHKERGALALAGPLGTALAGAVRSAVPEGPGGGPLLLVPVPSARGAVRARGHDPTLRLARAAARDLRRAGLPARAVPVLRQVRPVADPAGLGAAARHRNLHGALGVPPGRGARGGGGPGGAGGGGGERPGARGGGGPG
ncbi:ComF family protein, partial [Kitasatospora sp. NPDC059571]|uniref:ComF family protein n=1 Tax=Kitasatospora sp. NPDC059571 TaxID=3346871 RepID=UPI0036B624C0